MAVEYGYGNHSDVDAIIQLSARVQAALTASGSLQEIGPLEKDMIEQAISRRHCFVMRAADHTSADTSLLGCAFVRPLSADHFASTADFSVSRAPSPWLFLHSVMLDPHVQGRGLGVNLVMQAVNSLQDEDSQGGTLFLDCWSGNEKLRAFYSRIGFTFAAVVPEDDYEIAVFQMGLSAKTRPDTA